MPGRPSKFKPEYCDQLIEHLRRGYTFESFGAVAGVNKQTLYNWLKRHPAFVDAKKMGEPLTEMFYLQMGHRLALGQLRRVTSEEPVIDKAGRPVMDPNAPGQVLMRREYAPTNGSAATWIFMAKNMLGWRDRRDVNHGGQEGNPVRHVQREMTREERAAEIDRLQRLREVTDDG